MKAVKKIIPKSPMLGKVIEYSNPKSFTLQLLPIAQDKFVEGKLRSTKKKGGFLLHIHPEPWCKMNGKLEKSIFLLKIKIF